MKLLADKTTINSIYANNEVKIRDKLYPVVGIVDENGHIRETIWHLILKELRKVSKYYYPDIKTQMDYYNKFISEYPSLSDWINEDILTRVGKQKGSSIEMLNFNAGLYIAACIMIGLKVDYPYILAKTSFSAYGYLYKVLNIDFPIEQILDTQKKKIKKEYRAQGQNNVFLTFSLRGLLLYTHKSYRELDGKDILDLYEACKTYKQSDICKIYPIKNYKNSLLRLEEAMIADKILKKAVIKPADKALSTDSLERRISEIKHPKIRGTVERYCKLRKSNKEKGTVSRDVYAITRFTTWLYKKYPAIDTLSLVTKKIMDEYKEYIQKDKGGKELKLAGLTNTVSALSTFFMIIEEERYPDIPQEKVISVRDLPPMPKTKPRFIPSDELRKIMDIVRKYADPYFRNMVIILRWEGLRIDELLRLEKDALYYNSKNEPTLRVPPSKTNNERNIPVSIEAETALKDLLNLWNNANNNNTPITDRKTGKPTYYLLMKDNQMFAPRYVNDKLKEICSTLGLLKPNNNAKHTSHAFRHTIATELLNAGASMGTVMDFLGHESLQMVRVYAQMLGVTVRMEYNKTIALIEERERGAGIFVPLRPSKINMNTENLCKTILPIGSCYHSLQEKMCEFAYYCYGCRRIQHTKDDLPALEQQYLMELHLVTLAQEKGWDKEVDRHIKVADMIKQSMESIQTGGYNNAQS